MFEEKRVGKTLFGNFQYGNIGNVTTYSIYRPERQDDFSDDGNVNIGATKKFVRKNCGRQTTQETNHYKRNGSNKIKKKRNV